MNEAKTHTKTDPVSGLAYQSAKWSEFSVC